MKKKLSPAERDSAIASVARAFHSEPALELRAAADATMTLSPELVDELLAKAVARERVEIVLELLAYEQGKRAADGTVIKNRNCVRFRDGAMLSLGRSGKSTPFLRDHDKWNSTAIGGQVVESKALKVDDAGHYQISQTVVLKEPSAVERALRGLMRHVSIGWRPTGPVLCTACGTEVLEHCWHFPGDAATDAKGVEVEVEWEFTAAELVETSEVPVPGVPSAGIEGIRAALAAQLTEQPRGLVPQRKNYMSKMQALAAKLGLAADATEEEIAAAATVATDQLAILQVEAKIDGSAAVDKFISTSLAEGRIKPGDEGPWRELFDLAPDRARSRMAARAIGTATPAGLPLQSSAPDPTPAPDVLTVSPTAARDNQARAVVTKNGRDYDNTLKYAKAFGAKDPKAAVAKYAAGIEEG